MDNLESTCRACLQTSKKLISFDEKLTKTSKIVECFENLTSIKIKANEMSSKICKKCSDKLKAASEFKKQCLENDEKYRDLLGVTKTQESFKKIELVMVKEEIDYSSDDNDRDQHFEVEVVPDVKEEILVKQEEIKKETAAENPSSRKVPKIHKKAYFGMVSKKEKELEWECEFCDKRYEGKNARVCGYQHTTKNHAKEKLKAELEEKRKVKVFNCAFCPETTKFNSWLDCDLHEQQVHEKGRKFECDICGKLLRNKYSVEPHIVKHLRQTEFQCSDCPRKFKWEKSLANHQRKAHIEKPKLEQCPHCLEYFDKIRFKPHLLSHSSKQNYLCGICGKTFRNYLTHKEHVRTHSDQFEYQCDKCGKKFQLLMGYKKHLQHHENKEKGIFMQCPVCFKNFSRKTSLDFHMKVHTGIKDNHCEFCEKSFYQKHQLTRHILSQHLDSHFNCKLCGFEMRAGKSFQKVYIKHVREVHSCEMTEHQLELFEVEIRRLKCTDICKDLPASFYSSRTIPKCQECDLHFKSMELLNKHYVNVHPERNFENINQYLG